MPDREREGEFPHARVPVPFEVLSQEGPDSGFRGQRVNPASAKEHLAHKKPSTPQDHHTALGIGLL